MRLEKEPKNERGELLTGRKEKLRSDKGNTLGVF